MRAYNYARCLYMSAPYVFVRLHYVVICVQYIPAADSRHLEAEVGAGKLPVFFCVRSCRPHAPFL